VKKKPPPPRGNGITLCEPQTGHVKLPSARASPELPDGWSPSLRSARRRALRPNDRRIADRDQTGHVLGGHFRQRLGLLPTIPKGASGRA